MFKDFVNGMNEGAEEVAQTMGVSKNQAFMYSATGWALMLLATFAFTKTVRHALRK